MVRPLPSLRERVNTSWAFNFYPKCDQVDFINPGILDTYSTFNKIYEKPIVRSRFTRHPCDLSGHGY